MERAQENKDECSRQAVSINSRTLTEEREVAFDKTYNMEISLVPSNLMSRNCVSCGKTLGSISGTHTLPCGQARRGRGGCLPGLPGLRGRQTTWCLQPVPPAQRSPASPCCPAPEAQLAPRGRAGIRLGRCGQRIPGRWRVDKMGEGLSHSPSPLLAWLLGPGAGEGARLGPSGSV